MRTGVPRVEGAPSGVIATDGGKSTVKEKIRTILWGFKIAWKIDKKMLLLWSALSVGLSILPAIALGYNRQVVSRISEFIVDGSGTFADVVPSIVALGVIMTLIGLSTRINADLIYMMMYDSYYLGMEELLMDSVQKIELTDLLKSELNDEYRYIVDRGGSLTDLMSGFCSIVGKVVSFTSLLIVAYASSKTIFAISLAYILGVFILNFSFTERVRWDGEQVRKDNRTASYFEKMPEAPGTAKEIRIYENTEDIVAQWKRSYANVARNEKNRQFAIELRNFISGIGFYVFLIVMMVFSISDVAKGNIKTDVFLMVYALCMSIYNAVSGTARSIMDFDYGLFALGRQRRFLDMAPFQDPKEEADKFDAPLDEDTVFDVRNLTFCYKEGIPAIDGISFSVKKGQVVALVGQNGSGKTTLVKLLLNMYRPHSGDLRFYGRSYDQYRRDFIRKKIGVFFQDFFLFHHSLWENVGYGGVESIGDLDKVSEAIRKGGAWKVLQKMPKGLETLLGKRVDKSGVELSGGERQRVGVARAHMNDREILIFDEPASMLDPLAEMEQFMQIRQKLSGRTAILISHRIGFARLADRIIMLDGGRIAETGTHDELIARAGLYAHFFYEQAQIGRAHV